MHKNELSFSCKITTNFPGILEKNVLTNRLLSLIMSIEIKRGDQKNDYFQSAPRDRRPHRRR